MPNLDDLLAHAGWARGLAGALCADSSSADDLLQETWRAALTRGPERGDSPRGWLATVLRNLARQTHRADAARAERERRTARSEAAASAEDVLARAQLHERVSRAVLELEEPYRSTVLWCYFDGLSPDEIARRAGCPGATVRSRLKRALEQLRARFDRECGGRREWLAALAPLARDLGPAAPAVAGASILGGLIVTKKLAISLAGVALLLLAGWGTARILAARARERTGTPEPDAALASSASPDGSAEIASAPAASERATVIPGPMPSPAAPEDPAAPLGWIDVLAIDASTRAPIAGAQILWAASELHAPHRPTPWKAVSGWIDPEGFFEEHGRMFLADAKGRARVPRASYGFAAAARAPGLWAIRSVDLFDTDVDPLVLALEPDASLGVLVVGESGRPVGGVPVVLQASMRFSVGEPSGWAPLRVLVTDDAGRARLARAQFLRHTRDSSPTITGWRLVPPTGAREGPVEIDARNLPSEPIRFHLGVTGELDVVLQDADGRAVERDDGLFLQFRHADGTTPYAAAFAMTRGRIHLRGVALGFTIEASSYFADSFSTAKGSGPGPRDLGECARLVVTEVAARSWYEGRVVRPDGRPLAERAVEFDLFDEPPASADDVLPRSRSFDLRTDEQGVFRAPAPELLVPGAVRTGALVVPSPRRDGMAGRRIALAAEPSPGRNEIGDVVVEPLPLVASGRVVDQNGQGVPFVNVSAWGHRPADAPMALHPSFSTQGLADAAGYFELHGMIAGGPVTLQATGADGLSDANPPKVGLGSSGITLLLFRGGSVAGRLILPPDLAPTDVEVRGLGSGRGEPTPDQDGAFLFESVPPGVHTLEVCASRQATVMLSIPEFTVEAGRRTDLGAINVPASGRWIELRVVRGGIEPGFEEPVAYGYYRIRGGPTWSAEPFENGSFRILARDEPLDVEIVVSGMRPIVVEGLTEDRLVRVAPGIPLRFVLEGFETLDEPAKLGVTLWPADRSLGESERFALERGSHPQLKVDARGEVSLTAPWPGRYGVEWRVYRQFVREWDAEGVLQQPTLFVDVPEGEGELVIRTSLDPEALAAAAKRLLKR